MTKEGYSTIIILDIIKKSLDKVRKEKGFKSYNQVLIYLTTKKGVLQ